MKISLSLSKVFTLSRLWHVYCWLSSPARGNVPVNYVVNSSVSFITIIPKFLSNLTWESLIVDMILAFASFYKYKGKYDMRQMCRYPIVLLYDNIVTEQRCKKKHHKIKIITFQNMPAIDVYKVRYKAKNRWTMVIKQCRTLNSYYELISFILPYII